MVRTKFGAFFSFFFIQSFNPSFRGAKIAYVILGYGVAELFFHSISL